MHDLPDDLDRAALEQLSLRLFGKKLLLPIAAVFARNPDRLSSAEIARSLGVSPSSVQGPIAVLTELRFVHAIEASPTDRSSWLLKSDSPFWALATYLISQTTRSTLF